MKLNRIYRMPSKVQTAEEVVAHPDYRRLFEAAVMVELALNQQDETIRAAISPLLESIYVQIKHGEPPQDIRQAISEIVRRLEAGSR